MQAIVLCGGKGERLRPLTASRPKPLVEVDGRPIIEHILSIFTSQGVRDFILCLGYLGPRFEEHFLNRKTSLIERDEASVYVETDGVRIRLVDTGQSTMTGGRLGRVARYVTEPTVFVSYGDVVANVNLLELKRCHEAGQRVSTLTVTKLEPRFGLVTVEAGRAVEFHEKDPAAQPWINAGFMIVDRSLLEQLTDDNCVFEADVLPRLASTGQMTAYEHHGCWYCMDTPGDVSRLNRIAHDCGADSYPWLAA
ncbi:MAG TPA: sugar phosphate nucleotidyltransferase [Jatrophihabitans sp.]